MSSDYRPNPNRHSGPLNGAADFLKASYISRWCIINTTKHQSIAEHMYNVWTLVRQWGRHAGLSLKEQAQAEELALTHDLAEIRLGDIPTPVKLNQTIKEQLVELEECVYSVVPVPGRVKQLVKFCDTAEAILFLKLYGQGKHASDVRELLAVQMWERLSNSLFSKTEQQLLHDHFNETFNDI